MKHHHHKMMDRIIHCHDDIRTKKSNRHYRRCLSVTEKRLEAKNAIRSGQIAASWDELKIVLVFRFSKSGGKGEKGERKIFLSEQLVQFTVDTHTITHRHTHI